MTKVNDANKKKNKLTIYNEYLNHHDYYVKKYGKQIIVLMQVGAFYECYSTNESGPDLDKISSIVNMTKSKKNGTIEIVDDSNPYLVGFPMYVIDKYAKILVENNYNVIIIDQIKKSDGIVREVTNVFSPSTFIDTYDISSKGLMVFYVEYNNAMTSNKKICSIGMCLIDISIGTVVYNESHSESLINKNNAFDEAKQFYHHYNPAELIIYEINSDGKNKLIDNIDILSEQVVFSYEKVNPNFTKLSYQNIVFQKVYNSSGIISPLEYFNLGKLPMVIIAFVIGFDYIHQHNGNLTNKLTHPTLFDKHVNMILYNNAQYQLSIIDGNTFENNNAKFQSLYDVLNNCLTPMGKRLLKTRLCAPLINESKINEIYSLSEKIINHEMNSDIRINLKGICDLEKIIRKIIVQRIQPNDFFNLYTSMLNISNIIKLFINSELKKDMYSMIDKKNIKQFNSSLTNIEKMFDTEKLKNTNYFYNIGIHKDIDDLTNQIKEDEDICNVFVTVLNNIDKEQKLIIKHDDKKGYYLYTTLKKGKSLEEKIKKIKIIQFTNNIMLEPNELNFEFNKTSTKIFCKPMKDFSTNIEKLKDEYNKLLKEYFTKDVNTWYDENSSMLLNLVNMTTTIDYVSNNVFTSNKYHYTKPILQNKKDDNDNDNDNNESFIDAKELRHPITERLIDYEYSPHDISLNNNNVGNLIYGTNGCGKSILMKAVGLNLIMAQCGLYVPSKQFKFGIFNSLFTRIAGNDNLFKQESTYTLEMKELRCILKDSTTNSLVIGDEVCKGTEYLSGNGIVAATILKFSRNNIKFLFATHLHELSQFDRIQQLKNIDFFHIEVEEINNELVFSRIMKKGTGPQIYGIMVAKYILDDPLFINDAIEFKNELLEKNGINTKLVNDKKSLYNKNIYMDKCYICSSTNKLEAHHINHQQNFVKNVNGLIKDDKLHIVKDDSCNLIVLCSKCHDKTHNDEIVIDKIIKTTKGNNPSSLVH
jgi:DNA mismatch repair protein MutS